MPFLGGGGVTKSRVSLLNELVATDVVGGKVVLRCHKVQGGGQMGLAHPRSAKKGPILSIFQKTHGCQLIDLALIYGELEGKCEKFYHLGSVSLR